MFGRRGLPRQPAATAAKLAALFVLAVAACGRDSKTGPQVQTPAAVQILSGDQQHAQVGTQLPSPLVVKVLDANNRPIAEQLVNFRVVSGGGTVFAGAAITNSQGIAQELWTLGTSTAQPQKLEVRTVDSETGEAIVFASFTATADPGPLAALAKVSGDAQTGSLGASLPDSLGVKATDQYGNPIPGVSVTWAATSGGGSVAPATVTTDASGVARAAWMMGSRLDAAHTATANAGGLASATFTATATLPASAVVAKTAGDAQSAAAGSALATPLTVKVTLANGTPVPGAAVAWAVTGGGGSVTPAQSVTDANGVATAQLTLGTAAGQTTVAATVAGHAPVTFIATTQSGAAASLTKSAGDAQSATVGTAVAAPLAVRLRDQFGNPVAGVTVTWAVATGGGSLSSTSSTTDASGVATASWTLGTSAGAQSVTASVGGLPAVTFTATANAGAAVSLTKVGGDNQTATIGQSAAAPLEVRAVDQYGNGVPGVTVTFAATSAGTSVSPTTVTTDANGVAATQLTLSGTTTTNAVTASAQGLPTVTFTATGAAGSGWQLSIAQGNAQSRTAGSALFDSLVVRLTDANGAPVPNVPVTWSVLSGGGTINPRAPTTGAQGFAAAYWQLGCPMGTQSVSAAVAGLPAATFTATAAAGPVVQLIYTGVPQQAVVGSSHTVTVTARDQCGNPVSGYHYSWTIMPDPNTGLPNTGLSISPPTGTTDANGQATHTVTVGPVLTTQCAYILLGSNKPTFCITAVTVASVTITPHSATLTAVGQTVQLQATVQAGANVTPVPTPTWQSLDLGVATVDATGLVTAVGPGQARIVASASGKADTALVTVSAPSVTIAPASATLTVGGALTLGATLRDASGAVVPAATFVWTSLDPGVATVDANGMVQAVSPGSARITATSGGATGTAFVQVISGSSVAFLLSAGGGQACALFTASHDARCWGAGALGQLGDGSDMNRATPVMVSGGLAFVQISAGSDRTCGVTAAGAAYCWGDNSIGELGDSTTTRRLTPTPVAGGHAFAQISAGNTTTCALTTGGRAYCWAMFGSGPYAPDSVPTSLTFTQISASADVACGIATDGLTYCWGSVNQGGQLGDGTTTPHAVPAPVQGGVAFASVLATGSGFCGLTSGGTAYCWGWNNVGQLGDGTFTNRTVPTLIAGGLQFTSLTGGYGQTCGITSAGDAYCWGRNPNGELGDGTTTDRTVPTPVSGGLKFAQIAAGSGFTCGVTLGREVYCWGNNDAGQLALGSFGGTYLVPTRSLAP